MKFLSMSLLVLLALLSGCATTSAPQADDRISDQVRTPSLYFSATCDPEETLVSLRTHFPKARFFHSQCGSVKPGQELQFTNLPELRQALASLPASGSIVECRFNDRVVRVNLAYGQISSLAGPDHWALRGRARESASDFAAAMRQIIQCCRLADQQWSIKAWTMPLADAGKVCKLIGINQVDQIEGDMQGNVTVIQTVACSDIAERIGVWQGTANVGKTSVHLLVILSDAAISVDGSDWEDMIAICSKLESAR